MLIAHNFITNHWQFLKISVFRFYTVGHTIQLCSLRWEPKIQSHYWLSRDIESYLLIKMKTMSHVSKYNLAQSTCIYVSGRVGYLNSFKKLQPLYTSQWRNGLKRCVLRTMYNNPYLFVEWVRIKVDQYFILFKPLSHFAYGYSLI